MFQLHFFPLFFFYFPQSIFPSTFINIIFQANHFPILPGSKKPHHPILSPANPLDISQIQLPFPHLKNKLKTAVLARGSPRFSLSVDHVYHQSGLSTTNQPQHTTSSSSGTSSSSWLWWSKNSTHKVHACRHSYTFLLLLHPGLRNSPPIRFILIPPFAPFLPLSVA